MITEREVETAKRDRRVALEALVSAAVKAPSGDNLQPWRFVLDVEASRIVVCVDETRDRSPMNVGQRMARMAVGAALENMFQTASSWGWQLELEEPIEPAAVALRVTHFHEIGVQDSAIDRRVTNRRAYDRRPISADVLHRLEEQTPDLDGVAHTGFVTVASWTDWRISLAARTG